LIFLLIYDLKCVEWDAEPYYTHTRLMYNCISACVRPN